MYHLSSKKIPMLLILIVLEVMNVPGTPSEVTSRLWKRNATDHEFWQRNIGVVFFDIYPYMPYKVRSIILSQIDYFNSLTCIKWLPKHPWDDDIPYKVTFFYDDGGQNCTYVNGSVTGTYSQKIIVLGRHCVENYTEISDDRFRFVLMHEMGHAMGLYNEELRPNRDCWVYIAGGLSDKKFEDYHILPEDDYFSDFPYDLNSIMQTPTWILPELTTEWTLEDVGKIDGKLSELDIMKLNYLACAGPSYCQSEEAGPLLPDGWRTKCKKKMQEEQEIKERHNNNRCKPNIFQKPEKYIDSGVASGSLSPTVYTGPLGFCKRRP